MDPKEKLKEMRQSIDAIDTQMISLFEQRMQISEQIAGVKAEGNIAMVDRAREQQVIGDAVAQVSPDHHSEVVAFMNALMALSRLRQSRQLSLPDAIAFPPSAPGKTGSVIVAYQGVSGAWSEQCARRLFPGGQFANLDYFEDVFETVKSGRADYGVLPIETSQTGAVGEVYDLLRRHACYIVGEAWIAIAQCLLACEGAALSELREVFSHPEGFNQCRRFLKNRNWDLTACQNTATAAQLVKQKNSARYAAIGSRRAAEVHGLQVLAPDIMDDPNNRTRFIAIAAAPQYDETCGATGITFSTAHKSGALCAVLQTFMLADINLTRIESRPVSSDRYRFFADLEANVLSPRVREALEQAAAQCDYFEILGCYQPGAGVRRPSEIT